MSAFIVVEMIVPGVLPAQIRSFGPYESRKEAEQARRRRHLDNVLKDSWAPPRTFVAEIEGRI